MSDTDMSDDVFLPSDEAEEKDISGSSRKCIDNAYNAIENDWVESMPSDVHMKDCNGPEMDSETTLEFNSAKLGLVSAW